jgi:hypothetical protein
MPGWIPNWGWSSADLVRILPGDQYLDNPELAVFMHHAHGVELSMCQFWSPTDFVDRTQGPVPLMGNGHEVMWMNDNYLQHILVMLTAQFIP